MKHDQIVHPANLATHMEHTHAAAEKRLYKVVNLLFYVIFFRPSLEYIKSYME
jgi:hypothetical protein